MKISQLPEDVKIKALQYQKEYKGQYMWNNTTDCLEDSFDWIETEEGQKYWSEWHNKEFINITWKVTTTDTIVLSVIKDLNSRSILVGVNKHKRTLDREDLSRKDWLQHAYEECLDQANYLKKLISLEK
jgi:hypothetical protein